MDRDRALFVLIVLVTTCVILATGIVAVLS